jgi:hypothetical protein
LWQKPFFDWIICIKNKPSLYRAVKIDLIDEKFTSIDLDGRNLTSKRNLSIDFFYVNWRLLKFLTPRVIFTSLNFVPKIQKKDLLSKF